MKYVVKNTRKFENERNNKEYNVFRNSKKSLQKLNKKTKNNSTEQRPSIVYDDSFEQSDKSIGKVW